MHWCNRSFSGIPILDLLILKVYSLLWCWRQNVGLVGGKAFVQPVRYIPRSLYISSETGLGCPVWPWIHSLPGRSCIFNPPASRESSSVLKTLEKVGHGATSSYPSTQRGETGGLLQVKGQPELHNKYEAFKNHTARRCLGEKYFLQGYHRGQKLIRERSSLAQSN